jgi:hypothetical protein
MSPPKRPGRWGAIGDCCGWLIERDGLVGVAGEGRAGAE